MKAILLSVFACVGLAGCGDNSSSQPAPQTNASSTPLTAPVDYLGAVANAKQSSVAKIDTAAIDKAIQLFQVDHGRFPKDLDELVQGKYLAKIPEAPYGTKIVYDPATGTVKVTK